MKKIINRIELAGKLYEHALEKKVSGPTSKNPGTEYITGTISVATDEKALNIVQVHYTYVTATTKSGKPNSTYTTLLNIIDGKYKTIMGDGEDAAGVRIDSSIGLNEFYTDRNGTTELVSTKRNEGGFIHINNKNEPLEYKNLFTCDLLITNVRHIDADEDKGLPDKAIVKGAIFNDFNKTLMPVEFSAIKPGAIEYFEGLNASSSNPTFTKLWGTQINETVVTTITQENAFGEPLVRPVKSSRRDWVITGADPEPYEWNDESTLTAAEVNEAIKARDIMLATLKSRSDEYRASKNNAAPTAKVTVAAGEFNF